MTRRLAGRAAIAGAFGGALGAILGGAVFAIDGGASAFILEVLIAAAFAAGAVYLALRPSEQVLDEVTEAAADLGRANFGVRVNNATASTSRVTHEFNHMASGMQELFAFMVGQQAQLEAVLTAATDAMVALGRDTTVEYANRAALQMFGASEDDASGRRLIEVARDHELDGLVRRSLATQSAETAVITYGPRRAPLRAVAVPIESGGEWAALLILNDLTEVQRVDEMRRTFVSNVSHELRTPLAAISAMAETLEMDSSDPALAKEFLIRIRQQVERLATLVNELLDLSRIESGAIELRPERVDLRQLAEEAASTLQHRAEGAKVTISVDGSAEAEVDRHSFLRVMLNLLDNALKFSPEGSTVAVHARLVDDVAEITVVDEGAGVPPHDLPRVFERFYKVERSRSDQGVGLGLAIVKHLVRAHGGTVNAANGESRGAVFTVRVPVVFAGERHLSGV